MNTVLHDNVAPAPTGPVVEVPGARPVTLVPVERRGHPVGAFVVTDGAACFHPAVDVDRIVYAGMAATVLTTSAVALAVARRRPPAIGAVSMGPGGWISLKGLPTPPLRAGTRRPWWAHLLRARRLVVDPS